MAKAIYPGGILQWTPRVDEVNIVFANDPNQLATEIQGVESTIGINPQIESGPPTGAAITYSTLSSRVTAANNNTELPYVALSNLPGMFINQGQQKFNSYHADTDPYGLWNGNDITIPCNGYWSVRADQRWNQHGNNFNGLNLIFLYLNGGWLDVTMWDWSAVIASNPYHYPTNVLGSNGWTKLNWEGLLHKGDRLQVLSANGTFCPGIQIDQQTLKAMCHRTISGTFTSR